jgi:hypothetical protein
MSSLKDLVMQICSLLWRSDIAHPTVVAGADWFVVSFTGLIQSLYSK